MSEPLIRTKFHPPRVSSRVIARPRLLAQLGQQPERRLTLVVAPAGFGKTTVVSQWLLALRAASEGPRLAWLSLDAEDSTIERCWRYLVAAIRQAFPASCADSAALLDARQQPPPHYLADVLANDLAALPAPLVLVLDDYHQITSQDVHDALLRLVAHLPEHVELVLISRTSVPWPLGGLRGRGQLIELRVADLRFTSTEVRALLEATLSEGPVDTLAALLHTRTEGWAVSLQLACLSLRNAPDVQAMARALRGTSRHIADYLLDEVLAHQPEAIQRVLLLSALPERFCAELCAHLLEEPAVGAFQATIAEIERRGLFLVALDDEGTWYRYHQLVRDLLVFRLSEARGDVAVAALHRRCGLWFAARGLIEEAVHHALLAGDKDLAAELVADSYSELLEQDEGPIRLPSLLTLLPRALAIGPLRLLLAHAFGCLIRWDLSGLLAISEQIMARLTKLGAEHGAAEGADLRGDIAMLQGQVAIWLGDFARAAPLTEEAYRRIPPARANTYALATAQYAVICFHRGELARAVAFMRDHLRSVDAPVSTADATLLIELSYIHLLSGQLDQLAHTAKLLGIERPSLDRLFKCWSHYLLGRYHYERNELATAAGCFQQAISFPYNAQDRVHHDSLLGLARIALARGQPGQAADYGRQARAFAEERATLGLLEASTAFEATLALAQGDLVAAGWVAQGLDPTPYMGHAFWLEQDGRCLAAVQIAQATPASLDAATANLRRYLAEAEAAHNISWQIQVGALLALADAARGEDAAAMAALGRAVALAASRGFMRSLIDFGPTMAALLRRLPAGDPNAASIARLLAAFPAPSPRAPDAVAPLPSPLTEREREILVLLAERLIDKEIAARLSISLTTVRTHTRNIYGKLEVENRRAAISRARELGLLAVTPPGA